MTYLSIDGTDYACPFADAVRQHTPAEYETLKSDILASRRITYPVLVYLSRRWGWVILDGMTRAQIGVAHGIEIPIAFLKDVTDADGEERARTLNVARRHLTPEELTAERNKRLLKIVALRAEGKSLREIGDQVGVSHTRVSQDLADAALDAAVAVSTEPPAARRRKRQRIEAAAVGAAKRLTVAAKKVLAAQDKRSRLRKLAEQYGVPLSEDGLRWPALEAVAAAIHDLMPGMSG